MPYKKNHAPLAVDGAQIASLTTQLQKTATALEKVPEKVESRIAYSKEISEHFRQRLITVIATAIGVVIALFWQTAITDTIKTFIPVSGAWYYEIGVAILVTLLGGIVIYWLTRHHPPKPLTQ